ncbi:hypothetical protein C3L23_03510 [Nautilia sp. PV-1]|uniref:hypothetical protein n=1 Tax=Nautilia sp. PV-1 TaxID=2579250 RepID=UPI000FD776DE|nr:hypothetical protein [Nautilia sp. PV-1]AZV46371.1 hypothetical protein C3L23_03510 [Nautilia sp. PV-1]
MSRIYGKVENIEDISRINCLIRDEMLNVTTPAELSELKKRSNYLCTLTYSPFWKKKFNNEIEKLRDLAIKENRATVKTANYIAKYKNFEKQYEPWKKEIDVEEELKQIPQSVVKELTESIFELQNSVEILEDFRKSFCEIRKAMVLCENVECLDKLKRAVDILTVLPFIESFAQHFDEGILGAVDNLINKEKNRSITLANIIAEVNGWNRYYESVSQSSFETTAEAYLDKLLEEENKADTYIPTEAKYKKGAKTLWVVYYHPVKKREYAKRIYLPADAEDIEFEGPGKYKNRFGNEVWGIKVSYVITVVPTTIHVRGREIKLPERKMRKSKIVELPEIAQNIKITSEKPQSAMDIA